MPYSKGRTIHRTKSTALAIVNSCHEVGMKCKLTKLKKGYRVDKDWS